MRICYVLLSSTFGMHQYTADIANRLAEAGHDIHVVTTTRAPHDRYTAAIRTHTPVTGATTGFSAEGLRLGDLRRVRRVLDELRPDAVHFTGPHLWNIVLVRRLAAQGVPVIHSLHDLDPHYGYRHSALLKFWNRIIIASASHIVVHGRTYRERLLGLGLPAQRVTYTPLLHLFLGNAHASQLPELSHRVEYRPWALFFGRLERYKGVDSLLTACSMMEGAGDAPKLVIAGSGNLAKLWDKPLPRHLGLRNYAVGDAEAIDLFRHCGLVILPYIDATQSALVAAAYYFRKPVIVTRTGALPEYVEDGHTGYVVEPGKPGELARCLQELLDEPARLARMGAAGRVWYDVQRHAETETLFKMYEAIGDERVAAARQLNPMQYISQ